MDAVSFVESICEVAGCEISFTSGRAWIVFAEAAIACGPEKPMAETICAKRAVKLASDLRVVDGVGAGALAEAVLGAAGIATELCAASEFVVATTLSDAVFCVLPTAEVAAGVSTGAI